MQNFSFLLKSFASRCRCFCLIDLTSTTWTSIVGRITSYFRSTEQVTDNIKKTSTALEVNTSFLVLLLKILIFKNHLKKLSKKQLKNSIPSCKFFIYMLWSKENRKSRFLEVSGQILSTGVDATLVATSITRWVLWTKGFHENLLVVGHVFVKNF